ncbi:MAG TPA: hypothetical protein VHU84_10495 [Lacipirellulaceae bacterium]|nr:hypothetical protein [Lacipirellulaceae bacterium]
MKQFAIIFMRVCVILALTLPLPASAEATRTASVVQITPSQVPSINGKPVFPIVLSVIPAPDAKCPNGKSAWQEFRDAGAIFIRTTPPRSPNGDSRRWNDDAISRQAEYMDVAAKAGMFCIPTLNELSSVQDKNLAKEERLRQFIRRFRNAPALGVWKGADEPQWGREAVEPLLTAYRIIKEEDPNHPVWIAQAPRGTVEELRPYNVAYDIGGVDVYPIGYPPGSHLIDPNENKDISAVGDYTLKMLRVVDEQKPVWFTLQVAWSGVAKGGRTLRFPTFPQERFMTYEAIINGARGLVYFGGGIQSTLNERDQPFGYNWTFWDRVLRPVIEEIGDKSPLAAALCAADSKLPVKATGNAIELSVREVGRDVFVLACCRDPQKTAEVKFTGLPNDVGEAAVLYESPRKVTAKNGTFTDWFAPYDVHVYKFERR